MDFSYLTVLPRGRQIWDSVVFPPSEFEERREKLDQALEELGADGFLVYSDGLTRRYVSYITNYCNSVSWSASVAMIRKGCDPVVMSSMAPRDATFNKKYLAPHVDLEAGGLSLLSNHHIGGKTVEYIKEHGWMDLNWVGVNLDTMPEVGRTAIRDAFPELPDATERFDAVLARKSGSEIFAISQAASMAKRAGLDYLRMAVPGKNEREVAAGVDRTLRVYGADNVALLVSSGKGPVTLRQPEDHIIAEDEVLSVHINVMYLHYQAMFAATILPGRTPENEAAKASTDARFQQLVETITEAKTLKGVSKVDENGYILAQGIGADLKEYPLADSDAVLGEGSVFTLTLCENGAGCGRMVSDTFAVQSGRLVSLGGPGAPGISIR